MNLYKITTQLNDEFHVQADSFSDAEKIYETSKLITKIKIKSIKVIEFNILTLETN